MAGAYAAIETHEEVCAERWRGVDFKLNLVFAVIGTAIILGLGAGGWALQTLMQGQQAQIQALTAAAQAARAAEPQTPPRG